MIPTGIRTWTDPDWRAEALGWAEVSLGALGRRVTGPIEQPHIMPWSTAFRIPTTGGVTWLKVTGPGTAHEGPLLASLKRRHIEHVLLPLASDLARARLLFDDGGTTLRASGLGDTGDHDLAAWERVMAEYAGLQRAVERWSGELIAAGVPDERPDRLPAILDRLLDEDEIWARVDEVDVEATVAARQRLRELRPSISTLVGRLSDSGIAASVEHGDLHGRNVLVGPLGDRIFDWGDATVSHPFGTLPSTLGSIARRTELDLDGPEIARVRDAYTEAWTDVLPRSGLEDVAGLALDLGHIGKATAWERALLGLTRDEMGGHHGGTAAWLIAFVERLDRRFPDRRATR
jgi:hypothetical protein